MEGQTPYHPGLVHVTEDRDNKWEVDHIMDSRLKNKKLEYLIHWKGYDNLDHMWEPKSNLGNAKMLSMISMTLTPPPHVPSPLIPQISFCSSKSGWSCLLKSTCTTFLLIAWKSIFRRGVVLQSHLRDHTFNGLSQFFLSSYLIIQTSNREEILHENSLIS